MDEELLLRLPCAGRDLAYGNFPVMPSLRLDMLEREYHEPIRNRDKDWVLESQRKILHDAKPEPTLELGVYKQKEKLSPLMWSPALSSLVRKIKILSTVTVISHTYCNVDVYGFGISGRLFTEGVNNVGRFLIIEAYSIWNSLKYIIMVSALTLRSIFQNQESLLLKGGLKKAAVQSILKRLYFQYTMTVTTPPVEDDSTHSEEPTIQKCTHLEVPNIPEGFPQNLPDLMSYLIKKEGDNTIGISLKQELFIDTSECETGPTISRRNYKRRLVEEEEAYMRARQAWLDTPLRRRGLIYSRGLRSRGKIVIISSYKYPKRPLSLSVKCHASIECVVLPLSLSLLAIGPQAHVHSNPYLWSNEILHFVVKHSIQNLRIRKVETNLFSAYCGVVQSSRQECIPLQSIHFRNIRRKQCELVPPLYCIEKSTLPQYNNTKCLLGNVDKQLEYTIKPRREVGKGIRIITRAVNIGSIPVLLTLYLQSALHSKIKPIPALFDEALMLDTEGNIDYDEMKSYFESLIDAFDILVEVYIPHSHTIASFLLPGSTTFQIEFHKEDLFRFIHRDLYIFSMLIRIGYEAYYEPYATVNKLEVTTAWATVVQSLAKLAHFGIHDPAYANIQNPSKLHRNLAIVQNHLYLTAFPTDPASSSRVSAEENGNRSYRSDPMVVVQWSSEIFRKTLLVDDENASKPQQLLQVVLWQQGLSMGVIAYDLRRPAVYHAEDAPSAQRTQIEEFRCLPEMERALNFSIFVSMNVRHYSIMEGAVEVDKGIRIVKNLDAPRFDVLAGDYEERTAAATTKASKDLQKRFLNAKKETTYD